MGLYSAAPLNLRRANACGANSMNNRLETAATGWTTFLKAIGNNTEPARRTQLVSALFINNCGYGSMREYSSGKPMIFAISALSIYRTTGRQQEIRVDKLTKQNPGDLRRKRGNDNHLGVHKKVLLQQMSSALSISLHQAGSMPLLKFSYIHELGRKRYDR